MSGRTKIKLTVGVCIGLWMLEAFLRFGWVGLFLPPICIALVLPLNRLLDRWENEP